MNHLLTISAKKRKMRRMVDTEKVEKPRFKDRHFSSIHTTPACGGKLELPSTGAIHMSVTALPELTASPLRKIPSPEAQELKSL